MEATRTKLWGEKKKKEGRLLQSRGFFSESIRNNWIKKSGSGDLNILVQLCK